MEETKKDIEGFNNYEVTTLGEVIDKRTGEKVPTYIDEIDNNTGETITKQI